MVPPPKPMAPKRGSKSQSGCITCRIRRVKCDETRPVCTRCTTTRRRCDGYLPSTVTLPRRRLADLVRQTASLGPAAESLGPVLRQSPDPATTSFDSLLFDVFRHATGPGTASLLPSRFWTRDLLQIAHGESAVWHATLSLGALHRQLEADRGHRSSDEVPADDRFKREALTHYFRAISLAKSIADKPTLRALSVVLVAVPNMLGRWTDSRTHLFGGLRLLDGEHDETTSDDVDSTAEVLERLDVQAMLFSDSQAPYPYYSAVRLRSAHRRLKGAGTIRSYGQAGTLLYTLLRQFILLNPYESEESGSEMSLGTLVADLKSWEAKMQAFEGAFPRGSIPALSIRLCHTQLRLWMAARLVGDEVRWDTEECLFYFEYTVNLAEALVAQLSAQSVGPLSLEPAVIANLFCLAHRCRHPHLRRRAVRLLRGCGRQEGMWSSEGAAAVVERLIMAEEGVSGLEECIPGTSSPGAVPDLPWDVWASSIPLVANNFSWEGVHVLPEERRVKDVLIMVDYEKRKAGLRFLFPDSIEPEGVSAVQDEVYF